MLPSNYMLQSRYLHYTGACVQCEMPLRLVERYTPFRVTFFTNVRNEVIIRCQHCSQLLDSHVQPQDMHAYKLLA